MTSPQRQGPRPARSLFDLFDGARVGLARQAPLAAALAVAAIVGSALLASAGCRDAAPPAVTREEFVDAYVGLVRARIDARGDSAAYVAKRERAFLDAGVTAGELQAFVESGRVDPKRLREAWQSVAARLDTLYGGVTSQAPSALRRRPETPTGGKTSVIADTIPAAR